MSVHPADRKLGSDNPRLQCSCCGKWKRLNGRDAEGKQFTRFYGSCQHNNGGDHLAGKTDPENFREVCDECCQTECKRLAPLVAEKQTGEK